ncbi:MAG: response regulator [Phormidium tanganyikae FI6-MK23]|jgi:chemosensory pili system protein ChpA (sensor histidine kinase/response regulator)|nr:response regulator [Phormidium tanganyikae FI6-MK23]
MQPEQQQRIMGYFIEEAKDHLNTIEQGLLNLQGTMADPELVNEVFRAAHSVKGGAAMLSLHSIQKTSHRLEDYFKVLKEAPSIKPDRKLETLLLKVFDALKGHLEQLQSPVGLDEEAAKASLTHLEPVFSDIEQHLTQLERQATSVPANHGTVVQSETIMQDNALLLIFQNDVPAQLREMLQTFRQAETMLDARERLQDICLGLQGLGDAFGLAHWSQLIDTASRAIANSENAYRELAPLVITEIKQAQGLVLVGRAKEIAPSEQLQAMVLTPSDAAEMDLDLADFFAIANSDSSDELDFAGLDFATTDSTADLEDSGLDSLFDLSGSDELSVDAADDLSLDGMFDLPGLEEVPATAEIDNYDRNGPDMGMEELNSLADLFEGEMPDLGATWQREEVLDSSMLFSSSGDVSDAEIDDFANFLSTPSEPGSTQTNDLAGLFGNDLLEELDATDLASLGAVDEFELPDFSEDVTEIGASSVLSTLSSTEESAVSVDLELDELNLISYGTYDTSLGDFDTEDEGSLDNLGELFAGLDDTDLGFSSVSSQANSLDLINGPTDLDEMFETSSSENLSFDGFDTLDLDGVLDEQLLNEPNGTSELNSSTELALDPWDSLDLGLGSGLESSSLFEQTEMKNGSTKDPIAFDTDDLNIAGFSAEDLELSALGLDAQEDNVLNSLFSEEIENEVSIENLSFDSSESELFLFDDLELEDEASIENLSFDSSEPEISLSNDLGLDGLLNEPSPRIEAGFDLDELNDLDFGETAFSSNGFSTFTSDAEEPLGLAIYETLSSTPVDPFADLLDFSSSESLLEDELDSVNGSRSEPEDPLADLLDFSSPEPFTTAEVSESSFDETSFNLDDLIGAELPDSEALFEQELGALPDDLLNEFDLDSLEPQSAGLEAEAELDLGFTEYASLTPEDDFSDLNLDLFGAEAPAQESAEIGQSYQDELTLDLGDLTDDSFSDVNLDDFGSLLEDDDLPSDPSDDFEALLGMGVGAATIATLGAGFVALQSDSASSQGELDSLDDLLNSSTSDEGLDALIGGEEPTNLDDLDSLLDEAPPSEIAIDEDFDNLESLLADAPEETTQTNFTATEADAEFGDLEKMLEESDMTMSGSSTSRTSTPPGRRSTRAAKGFSEQTMRVPIKHLDNLSNLVGELVVNRNSLEQDQERLRQSLDNLLYQVQQLSDVGQRMQDLYERSLLESSLLASRQNHRVPFGGSERNAHNGNSMGVEYDPLEMDRFTGFHSLSQEMIELIVRVRESSSDIEFIVDETDQVTRMFRQVTTQLQEGLTRSRMVPFAQTADRLPRAVRDIAMKCGKQAELVIEGRDTLIDKMILEHLYDPMTHLVNNAITHGIEDPDVRRAAGKSPTGRITIRAFHQGNQTVISVSDDGAGVDVERVRSKAIEKGLITAAEAKSASRLDIYDLLFHPGFSTKDQADDFSGRGVGMDVVRTSLSEIRGAISTDSTQSKGTTFTIRLPLTLSISKALCCISDRARIAFPMDGVEDMLDIPKERLQPDAEGQPYITWRDTVLPVRPLRELLSYSRHLSRGTVYGGNQEDDMVSIVILRSAGNYLALQVDQVLGEQEIVIKQLEGPVPKPIGVAGATVLGDGRIMPIADVLELIDLSVGRIRRDAGSMWEQGTAQPVIETAKTEPMVLIVDDSITVRELLSMTFNKVGYRVEQARDGQEAWEKLRSGLPCDIVFCDIEMPRMDGLELLSRIQKDPNLANLPIAMLTSRGADRHRQMAASLGASGYFTKPYLEEALLDAAQRMLKGEILISANSPGNS